MIKNGFTLFELMFTLLLCSILFLFSLGSLTKLKQKNEREFLINEIRNAVGYAKIHAFSDGRALTLLANNADSDWSQGIDLLSIQPDTQEKKLIHRWNWKLESW